MKIDFKDKNIYTPTLLIEFKGYPINRFTAEVYMANGETFDPYFVCHEDNIHAAYERGFAKLCEAMKSDGTYYRIEKYTNTLKEFVLEREGKI